MRDIIDVIKELLMFIRENKKWWLLPVVTALVLFGALLMTAGTAPVPVFVYPVA
ncbi:MAG: DUF5989 family protein [Candidatus Nanohaloarchaea archaeon]